MPRPRLSRVDTSLIVALVGVGGTLAGVALSLLWQTATESRRHKREEAARFHADRRTVYARFLSHLSVRRKYASDLSIYWDTPYFDAVRDAAPDEGEWLREAQEIMAEIHLLGDSNVIRAATSLLMAGMTGPLILFSPAAFLGLPSRPKPTLEQIRERAKTGEKLFKDAYGPCLQAMRANLSMPATDALHVI